jgi:hypothetical protein
MKTYKPLLAMGLKYATKCSILLFFCLLCSNLPAQSFKKGFKQYTKKRDTIAATRIFNQHLSDDYEPLSRYLLATIQLRQKQDFTHLILADSLLIPCDSLFGKRTPKQLKKFKKRYKITVEQPQNLRLNIQKQLLAEVFNRGTISAFDSLNHYLHPLPFLQDDMDTLRGIIVNNNLESPDYATATSILKKHIQFVDPENYTYTRNIHNNILKIFQNEFDLCALDRFSKDHPNTFVARDCWNEPVRKLLCDKSLAQMLDFHAQNSWTSLENLLITGVLQVAENADTSRLAPAQKQRLADLRLLSGFIHKLPPKADTLAVKNIAQNLIQRYAPRFSTYSIMIETVQYLSDRRAYSSARALLEAIRPYFPDTLPANCKTNFDFQKRVKPYIDGVLPILANPEKKIKKTRLDALNTVAGDETSPVLTYDGRCIYFAAAGRTDQLGGYDIFVSYFFNNEWQKPTLLKELSGRGNQLPLSITADGKQMLLSHNQNLCLSQLSPEGTWQKPAPIALHGLTGVGRACLSADGRVLILEGAESEAHPLYAPDMDLYVSYLDENGVWSQPAGMGASINTDKQEGNPYLHPDGQTLYYTTNGYPGLGKSDVFVAKRKKDSWTRWERPENLGKEINNTLNHKGFSYVQAEKKWAVYASNAKDTDPGDLWLIELDGL